MLDKDVVQVEKEIRKYFGELRQVVNDREDCLLKRLDSSANFNRLSYLEHFRELSAASKERKAFSERLNSAFESDL
jgi:predicted ATP-binding protein involved in virulence